MPDTILKIAVSFVALFVLIFLKIKQSRDFWAALQRVLKRRPFCDEYAFRGQASHEIHKREVALSAARIKLAETEKENRRLRRELSRLQSDRSLIGVRSRNTIALGAIGLFGMGMVFATMLMDASNGLPAETRADETPRRRTSPSLASRTRTPAMCRDTDFVIRGQITARVQTWYREENYILRIPRARETVTVHWRYLIEVHCAIQPCWMPALTAGGEDPEYPLGIDNGLLAYSLPP